MPKNITFPVEEQPQPYRRLRAIGHTCGCCCEACFVYVERAIEKYLPGFFPADPLELRLKELERANIALRRENDSLRREMKESALPLSSHVPATISDRYQGVDLNVHA